MSSSRSVAACIASGVQEDGAGARTQRALGGGALPALDPFAFVSEWRCGAPRGFADHPHRGVETITLVTAGGDGEGELVHEASDGTTQRLAGDGGDHLPDVVHTHCGRGVIVSELPAAGIVHGLHVWLNTSRRHKMRAPETTVAKTEAVVVEPGGAAGRDVGAALRDARAADEGDVLSGLALHVAPRRAPRSSACCRAGRARSCTCAARSDPRPADGGRRRRPTRADAGCCCGCATTPGGGCAPRPSPRRRPRPGHARRAVRPRPAALRAAAGEPIEYGPFVAGSYDEERRDVRLQLGHNGSTSRRRGTSGETRLARGGEQRAAPPIDSVACTRAARGRTDSGRDARARARATPAAADTHPSPCTSSTPPIPAARAPRDLAPW